MGVLDQIRQEKALREAEGYLEFGMPAHAIRVLTALGPCIATNGLASYLLGEALREQARYKEALVPLERAVQFMDANIHVYLALAWCYKRTDQLPMAIEALERAIEIEPLETVLYYNLACYWSLSHNRNVSLRYLAKAFEMDIRYRELAYEESDFDNLRNDPEFLEMTHSVV